MKPLLPRLLLAAVAISACDSVAPDESAGDNELITRVTLALTPAGGGPVVTAAYNDADSDGILDPGEFTPLALKAGTTYAGSITFGGASVDVTAEVRAEGAEHQVIYTPGGGVSGRLAVAATDRDSGGLPIGLQFSASVTPGGAASGTLRVVLAHYDQEVKRAGIPSSEADFDGSFPVTISP